MTDTRLAMGQAAAGMRPLLGWLAAAAAVCALGGLVAFAPPSRVVLFSMAATLAALAIFLWGAGVRTWLRHFSMERALAQIADGDPATVVLTDADGRVLHRNPAALATDAREANPLAAAVSDLLAAPGDTLARMIEVARRHGHDEETVPLRSGRGQIGVHRAGPDRLVWRITREEASGPRDGDAQPPLARVAPDGTVLGVNPAMAQRVGATPPTIDALAVVPPLRHGKRQQIRGVAGEFDAMVLRVARPDGDQDVYLFENTLTGLSDDDLFERLPVPILQIEPDGSVARANRLARGLLRIDAAARPALSSLVEGLGRPVGDWLADTFAARGAIRSEIVRASRVSDDLFLQITLGRLGPGDGGRLVAVLHDATELKTLEAQFVQSQKMQAIGQLAGGVAHDFNNLLTAISGHCDLLLLRHDEGDPDFSDLEQINQNANRAASLVGQLLAFSRKQNLRPEPLDLRDILAELTHLLNRLVGERISLDFDHDPALRMVRADRRQLEQVIMNLVVNARDAMPEGGPIRIVTRMHELRAPLLRDRVELPQGSYVLVQVEDEGCGISAERLPKIFEPFFTSKRAGEGTGLGLSTAYGIVKQTGGYIFADSVAGEGTTFSVYFPASSTSDTAPGLPDPEAARFEPRGGEGVILLVEDEAPVRAFASRALRLRGYTVIEAEDGETALELLADPGLAVNLFVTDVIMPGLDGPSWVRRALVDRPGTRVVFVSGYAEESFADVQSQIAQSVFLPKPFSLADLTVTVARQLEARRTDV